MDAMLVKMKEGKVLTEELAALTAAVSKNAWTGGKKKKTEREQETCNTSVRWSVPCMAAESPLVYTVLHPFSALTSCSPVPHTTNSWKNDTT